jgi:hypothetical protein
MKLCKLILRHDLTVWSNTLLNHPAGEQWSDFQASKYAMALRQDSQGRASSSTMAFPHAVPPNSSLLLVARMLSMAVPYRP